MQQRRTWLDVKGRGFFLAVAIAFIASLGAHGVYTHLIAKAPGDTHCYGGVCHRVYTLDETARMIGQTVDLVATHYDSPEYDKFNVGQYTSSGEEFDAENVARTSASNFPDGTELLLWHPRSKQASHVRVNDFGPFKGNRTLDVTRRNAEAMGWEKNGVATLRVTVVWVPSPAEARYRKARVYPPSLGQIGIVESHQLAALADMLIRTSTARNSSPGQGKPDVAGLLASLPAPRPGFRSGGAETAQDDAVATATGLVALAAALPRPVLGILPDIDPVFAAAPAFRSEAAVDGARLALDARRGVEQVVVALPPPPATDLASELTPPVVVATAIGGTPVEVPAVVAAPVPAVAPIAEVPAARAVDSNAPPAIDAGFAQSNRPKLNVVERSPDVAASSPAPVERPSTREVADAAREVPSVASVTPEVVVASARVSESSFSELLRTPAIWIGIGLMLSSLWGAGSIARQRRSRAADALASRVVSQPLANGDALETARAAAERAEARARAVLSAETSGRGAQSEDELSAREDLARELALRDLEREQEATMRARLAAAAEAHEQAQRDLAAIEATRIQRAAAPSPVKAPVAAAGRVSAAPPVRAVAPRPEPARALANDVELARFPGLADRALVGGIIGLPGATGYWGNTVITGMRLEGSARSGSPMRIDGVVDGACLAPVLLITEGASVTGIVAAETIIVLGRVSGTISARKVFVASTAQVEGDVYYESMSIDPQAHCDVSFSRLPKDSDPLLLADAVYKARAA